MMYVVEARFCEVFTTYEAAEEWCFFNGIHPEEIMEMTPEEAEEYLG